MDKDFKRNVLLGFFILIGAFLFVAGIFFIGAKNELFQDTFPLMAHFKNATGLKLGSNVRYNGVKVGIVKSVTLLNDTLVDVVMQIEESKRTFIHHTAIAAIASDGLMGDKLVNITAGKWGGEAIENNDVLAVRNPLIMDEVMQSLNLSNNNLKVITDNLKTLTTDINAGNGPMQQLYKNPEMAMQLKRSFSNLDNITGKVLTVSATLEQITTQIKKGNGALGEIISDTIMANNLTHTFTQLKATSDELMKASNNLNLTLQHSTTGKGTFNMLLTDTAFANTLQQSMNNINKASAGLDQNMEAMKHNFLTRGYFRRLEKKKK